MFRKIEKKKVLSSLSRHKAITNDFIQEVTSIPRDVLENVGSDLAKKAVSMSWEVDGDLHQQKAFLRFSVSSHGVLYAKTSKMEHKNEKELLIFFKNRFPLFIILIESRRGVFYIDNKLKIKRSDLPLNETLKLLETERPEQEMIQDLKGKDFQELWRNFAQSQIIEGREESQQIRNLSKKWKNVVPIDKTRKKSLDEYL
jgi:hypothetical protein